MRKMYGLMIVLIAVMIMVAAPAQASTVYRWETLGTYNVPSSRGTVQANVNRVVKSIKLRIQDASVYVYSINVTGQNMTVNQTFPAGQSIEQHLSQPTYLNRIQTDVKDNGNRARVRVDVLVEQNNNGGGNPGNPGTPQPSAPTASALHQPGNITHNSVNLSWSRNNESDFASYQVFRVTGNSNVDHRATRVATITNNNNTTYTDTGLSAGTQYSYRVYTFNTSRLNTPSNQVSVTTHNAYQPPVQPPVKPPVNPGPQPIYGWDLVATRDVPDYRTTVTIRVGDRIGGIKISAFNAPVTIYRVSYDADGANHTLNVNRVFHPGQDFTHEFMTPVNFGSARVEMADFGRDAYVYAYTKAAPSNQPPSVPGGNYQNLGTLSVVRNFRALPLNVNRTLTHLRLQVHDNQVFVNRILANVNGQDQVLAQSMTLNRGVHDIPSVLAGRHVRHLTFEIRTTNSASARVTVSGMVSGSSAPVNPGHMIVRQAQVSSQHAAYQQFSGYFRVTDQRERLDAANTLRSQIESLHLNDGIKRSLRRAIDNGNYVVFRVSWNSEYILAWYF